MTTPGELCPTSKLPGPAAQGYARLSGFAAKDNGATLTMEIYDEDSNHLETVE
jgi:hypothetical protein